jgi:hypothetical protein
MESLWPWLAVASAGALHGLNPAAGWIFVVRGIRSRGRARTLQALLPIALGQVAAVAAVAAAVPAALRLGLAIDRSVLRWLTAGLLLALAARHFRCHATGETWQPAGPARVALWSFLAGTTHGAGWMLVPALTSVCGSDLPAREITASGSMLLALAAVGIHMAAMLVAMVAAAAGARRGLDAAGRWIRQRKRSGASAISLLGLARRAEATAIGWFDRDRLINDDSADRRIHRASTQHGKQPDMTRDDQNLHGVPLQGD